MALVQISSGSPFAALVGEGGEEGVTMNLTDVLVSNTKQQVKTQGRGQGSLCP